MRKNIKGRRRNRKRGKRGRPRTRHVSGIAKKTERPRGKETDRGERRGKRS